MENHVSRPDITRNDSTAGANLVADWHPADVQAELKKRGHSLAGLSVAHGYHPTAAGKALKRSWPALEGIIAGALDMDPALIWPTRYDSNGQSKARGK